MRSDEIAVDTSLPQAVDPHGDPDGPTQAEVVVSMEIDAEPETVWQALTTNEGLDSWIGAGSRIGTQAGDDLCVDDVVSGQRRRGVLDEVSPSRRLGYTWWPEAAPDQATRVSISLEPSPGGTLVTVVESQPSPVSPRLAPPSATIASATIASATVLASISHDPRALARHHRSRADWHWRVALLVTALSHRTCAGATALQGATHRLSR